MSVQTFFVGQNDRLPVLDYVPQDGNGDTVVVTPGDTVVFSMRNTRTGVVQISRASAGVEAGEGGDPNYFRYIWNTGDTSVAGTFDAEFAWDNGGKELTFPNNRRSGLRVEIADDIA